MYEQELTDFLLEFGNLINSILSKPSIIIPFLTSNIILIFISVLIGWVFSKKAVYGFRTLTSVIFSILFYGFMRWIGAG